MLVIADKCGGLCNRLWTLANVVAWGLEHDRTALSLGFGDAASHFPGLATRAGVSGWVYPSQRMRPWTASIPRLVWRLAYRVNLRTRTVPHLALADHESIDLESVPVRQWLAEAPLTFLTGLYHLAPKALRQRADEIRRIFQPAESVRENAERVVSRARAEGKLVVGVHIRHGDYRTFCDGLMFYTTEEYADLMRHLTTLWPEQRVSFVLCSDEPQPADAFVGLRVHDGPGDRYGDLHSLALCDYIVGPSSTFSRWASFWGRTPMWMMDWRSAQRHGAEVERYPRISSFSMSESASHLVDSGSLRELSSS